MFTEENQYQWLLFTQNKEVTHKKLDFLIKEYNEVVPFTQDEILKAKFSGYKFGHLFEEKADEIMFDRKFHYVSTMTL
jgi:hypothetical protein